MRDVAAPATVSPMTAPEDQENTEPPRLRPQEEHDGQTQDGQATQPVDRPEAGESAGARIVHVKEDEEQHEREGDKMGTLIQRIQRQETREILELHIP